MPNDIGIYWFRQDLRLADNPALSLAAQHSTFMPIYILDDTRKYALGGASKCWLHHSLQALNHSLDGGLSVYQGDPMDILSDIIARHDVKSIYSNCCYEPWCMARDARIKQALQAQNIAVHYSNGSLLWEPWTVKKNDGLPYKIFTPFYNNGCLQAPATPTPRKPLPAPHNMRVRHDAESTTIEALALLPTIKWDKKLIAHWDIGEHAAHKSFSQFMQHGLPHYKDGRDYPAQPAVSRLSAHLVFGEISAHQLWHGVRSVCDDANSEVFCKQLGWREFSYYQLYHQPDLPTKNLQAKFDNFPWVDDRVGLEAWQRGQTGVPMVDAGMRELWQTGTMHNRVRMIVGSFLVKNLRIDWRHGADWFWDMLLDADLANNSANWQWVAGCGADAAPYFRIFNPVIQGQKFDMAGDYIRKFIPELAALPNKYLFNPWEAPEQILTQAGIELGKTYPNPIIDLKQSRTAALQAFQSLKQ